MLKTVTPRSAAITILSLVAVSLALLWPNWRSELKAVGYAQVYRLVGQAAVCYSSEEIQQGDGFNFRDYEIEVGQAEIMNPHGNRQQLVLARVSITEYQCLPDDGCSFSNYSGNTVFPPEAITFGKRLQSAGFTGSVDVYSSEDPATAIPVKIDLAWTQTGERSYQIKDVFHRTTPQELIVERVKETAYPAHVLGTIDFLGITHKIGPESWSSGQLYTDRIGQVYVTRKNY